MNNTIFGCSCHHQNLSRSSESDVRMICGMELIHGPQWWAYMRFGSGLTLFFPIANPCTSPHGFHEIMTNHSCHGLWCLSEMILVPRVQQLPYGLWTRAYSDLKKEKIK